MTNTIRTRIRESIAAKERLLADEATLDTVNKLAEAVSSVIAAGGRILLCGNGGSASDALHIAGELVGRFQKERDAWSAIVLNADVSTMTAIANDYGYDEVFSRQTSAHLRKGDLLIGFSTSGNSQNVLRAVRTAKELGGKTAVFSGGNGGKLKSEADFPIVIPEMVTARIQECHILLGHIICELVEESRCNSASNE